MPNPNGRPGVKLTVTIGNKRKTFGSIEAAAKFFKIPYGVLYQRLYVMGWDAKTAVTTPVRKQKKRKTVKKRK